MAIADYDELNLRERKLHSVPYEEYFSVMDLTKEDKERRIQFSEEFEDVMLFIFNLFLVMQEYDDINVEYIIKQVKKRYSEIVLKYIDIDDYVQAYVNEFARNTIDVTIDHSDDDYYTSFDRARYIAENEANTIFNYANFRAAIEKGYTKKRWDDVRDNRERATHLKVGGTVIPINDAFLVGDSLMMFPKDTSMSISAEEIVNCRCTIKYLR